jgi:hypothetical protein
MAKVPISTQLAKKVQIQAFPIKTGLLFRLFYIILTFLVMFFVKLPFNSLLSVPSEASNTSDMFEIFLQNWARFDGGFYTRIALEGYHNNLFEDKVRIAFYPLYPHMVRWLAYLFGFGSPGYVTMMFSGIFISTLTMLAAVQGLYRLVHLDYTAQVAQKSVLYLLAYPYSFFLLAVYTEALFLALAVWAFYFARLGKWHWVGILCALSVLTRNQGLVLVAALVVEYFWQKKFKLQNINYQILTFVWPVLALFLWWLINYWHYGNPFVYTNVQAHFGRFFEWPHKTFLRSTELFFTGSHLGDGTNLFSINTLSIWYDYPIMLCFLGLCIVSLYLLWQKRSRLSYQVYFILSLLLPFFQPTKYNLLFSFPRYYLIIFPAFLLLAIWGEKSRLFHFIYLTLGTLLGSWIFIRFTLNYLIG